QVRKRRLGREEGVHCGRCRLSQCVKPEESMTGGRRPSVLRRKLGGDRDRGGLSQKPLHMRSGVHEIPRPRKRIRGREVKVCLEKRSFGKTGSEISDHPSR